MLFDQFSHLRLGSAIDRCSFVTTPTVAGLEGRGAFLKRLLLKLTFAPLMSTNIQNIYKPLVPPFEYF